MKAKKSKVLLTISILSFFLARVAFAEYAQLDGKWVSINGPVSYKKLGVALSEEVCNRLITILNWQDKEAFRRALELSDVLRIKNHTKALVVEVKLFAGKAKVVILEGLHEGFSGWIPIEWLRENQRQPTLSRKVQFKPYKVLPERHIAQTTLSF